MERAIEQGYRIPISKWRWTFVKQQGLQWVCECADSQAFGGNGYECCHVVAVKQWLRHRAGQEVA